MILRILTAIEPSEFVASSASRYPSGSRKACRFYPISIKHMQRFGLGRCLSRAGLKSTTTNSGLLRLSVSGSTTTNLFAGGGPQPQPQLTQPRYPCSFPICRSYTSPFESVVGSSAASGMVDRLLRSQEQSQGKKKQHVCRAIARCYP